MLKTYRMGAKFKKEVMKVFVNQMFEKDLARLSQIFKNIDVDNSGTITVQELHHALQQEGTLATVEEIEEIIEKIGYEQDEQDDITISLSCKSQSKPLVIKYSDFLNACIDERRVFTREKLWSIFKYFDTQNVNYLSKEAIREFFARHGRSIPFEKIDEMLSEIDPRNEKKINFEAFCQMMGVAGVQETLEFKDIHSLITQCQQFSPIFNPSFSFLCALLLIYCNFRKLYNSLKNLTTHQFQCKWFQIKMEYILQPLGIELKQLINITQNIQIYYTIKIIYRIYKILIIQRLQ